jgi:general secretion pathway protein K
MIGRFPGSRDWGRRDGGFVVVTALWLLAALAVLATIASIYLTQSARALTALDAAAQMDMLTSAGIELAAYQLSAPATIRRPTHGRFGFRLAKCNVTVEYLSEAARINLNMASKAMLAGLFAALGADGDAAGQFADRVLGWRGALKPSMQDAEDGVYRAARLSYLPRRAPFNSADELWLLPGLPPAIVERAMPYVTVYSGIAEINVLDAAPEAIAALPDMTPGRLDAFLSERESLPPDPELVLGALGGKQIGATTGGSDAYRVRIRVILPNGRQKTSEGVIMIPPVGEKEAFHVLAWQEDVDPHAEQ